MTSLAALVLPVVVAYAATWIWMVESWLLPGSYYSHGLLLPLLAALVVWQRRTAWRRAPAAIDARGWLLLGPALLVHACGAALMIDSLSAASLVLAVPGVVWLAFGGARASLLWPVLALTLFAVPTPMVVTGRIAFELKEIAVSGAVTLGEALGLELQRRGAALYVGSHPEPLEVADACSGLRSLIALTTLGYCMAFFTGPQRGARRWVLLAAALPIALLTNVLRITAICVAAAAGGVAFAATTGHDVLSWVAWMIDLGLLIGLDLLVLRRLRGAAR